MKHIFKTLSSTPDLYLDELWLELQERHGVSVSISTILRTLIKGGYSMKKVRIDQMVAGVVLTRRTALSHCNRVKRRETSTFCSSHRHLQA